ncbi:MAG: histidine phosphatase family protein, partial [Planctomycetota bacterium]
MQETAGNWCQSPPGESGATATPCLLLLARHATCGTSGFIGASDVSLSPEGRKQAAALARVVAAKKVARCFCSPMKRCLETAAAALAGTALKPEVDDDLREINFGRWEGLRFEEISRRDPEYVWRLAHFDRDFAFPEGEAVGTFLERVRRAVGRMAACPEQPVLAFTHAGVITAAICQLLGLYPWQYVLFQIQHASVTTLQVFGFRGVLAGLNERGEGLGARG